ncbi:MAG: putative baseplate assembly protein, partial [Rhodanobacter sp.]
MSTAGPVSSHGVIGCAVLPACSVPARRDRLRLSRTLNGIDYVEVGDDGTRLCVHLFGDIPQGIGVANVRISGGDRITGLRVLSVNPELEPDLHDDACLRVVLDREGDHTAYCLCLVDTASGNDAAGWLAYPGFDPRYACVTLHFRLDCVRTLDCADTRTCVQSPTPPPEINYLARDYASFRQLFLDRLALDMPAWQERHVPDLGIALVETLAYTADYLSYYQDAVATEAYLATARRRISVRRHARLVDYRMHEGCNARALVAFASDTDLDLELDNLLLLVPPPEQNNAKPGVISADQLEAARTQGALMFEPMRLDDEGTFNVVAAHSAIRLHRWGDKMCCLPRGSTRATLVDAPLPSPAPPVASAASINAAANDPAPNDTAAASAVVQRALRLGVGDLLIFEEVRGPQTGNPADADPAHRHAVRLT